MYKPPSIVPTSDQLRGDLNGQLDRLKIQAEVVQQTKNMHMSNLVIYKERMNKIYGLVNQTYDFDTDRNYLYWLSMIELCELRIEGLREDYFSVLQMRDA